MSKEVSSPQSPNNKEQQLSEEYFEADRQNGIGIGEAMLGIAGITAAGEIKEMALGLIVSGLGGLAVADGARRTFVGFRGMWKHGFSHDRRKSTQ
jgi:hypothetical protein